VGLDSFLFEACAYGTDKYHPPIDVIRCDIRDVENSRLDGFDAVIHLAALCNDPLGNLNAQSTAEINHVATQRLGELAKRAGVARFLHSSTCSLYGAQGNETITESVELRPMTPYGRAKVAAEQSLRDLADENFSPTYLRNATAYGYSSRLRGDLVVNNLTGYAVATRQVFLKSDGSSWRPLVHIEDIAQAFLRLAEAPREVVHNEAFNVGSTVENYQIRDVAAIVADEVHGSEVTLSRTAFNDPCNYRVSCDKLAAVIPSYQPEWTVRAGVQQLKEMYRELGLTLEQLEGPQLSRHRHVLQMQDADRIDSALRWQLVG
jgi:nucleoside-diphosphate-sugar epimerase